MPRTPATTAASVTNYRHRKILEMVYERKSVTADELAGEFGVSRITIRRDLNALADDKLIERTRGGATRLPDVGLEALFESKGHTARREKALIGRHAASLVGEHETVFLNGGSTTLEVLRALAGRHVRVVTNNAACVGMELEAGPELILLGGEYRPQSRSLVGSLTVASLQPIYAGITILGINGVSVKRGCTTAVQAETAVNRAMIENTHGKVVIVADHHKLNAVSSFLTCGLERIDLLVTDWLAPQAFCDELAAAGVAVQRVSEA
jgi:DeoR/GlpR family transcriptional regulator of sugar metabolism